MGANRKKPADDRSGRLQGEFDLRAEDQFANNPISFGAQVVSGSKIASLPRKLSVTPGAHRSPAYRRQKAKRDGIMLATSVAAFSLATCSAGFSVFGLTSIFASAPLSVVGMGVALEIGKLSGVAWLGRCRHTPTVLKVAMATLVVVLMGLNSVGCYGFLVEAHVSHMTVDEAVIARHTAQVEASIAVQGNVIGDLDRRIAQIDGAVLADTSRGRTKSALAIIADQSRTRTDLVVQRHAAAEKLAELKVQRAAVDDERHAVEADLGSVRYLARLLGAEPEQTMRWFILAVSLLLDPAAVLLLLAANV
jgi:hypothetical protein